jgi:uncharacterized membrane protein
MGEHEDYPDGPNLHRMVFFSDAVFAIILTLLALELRAPLDVAPGGLFAALGHMTPHFIAFAMSFAIISVFWLAHLSTLRRMVHFDWLVAILNLVLLFTIALIPFACALLGEYRQAGQAWQFYCVLMIAASAAQTVLLIAITRDKGRLIGGVTAADFQHRLMRALSPGVVFAIGLALSLTGHDWLSAYCWVLFAPVMLGARIVFNMRTRKPKPAKA